MARFGQDALSRSRARSDAQIARNDLKRARESKQSLAEIHRLLPNDSDTRKLMIEIKQRSIVRSVQSARQHWRWYLQWRRIYRADERGDYAEVSRLCSAK